MYGAKCTGLLRVEMYDYLRVHVLHIIVDFTPFTVNFSLDLYLHERTNAWIYNSNGNGDGNELGDRVIDALFHYSYS